MRRMLYENSLSLVFLGLCVLALVGQSLTGHHQHNEERQAHGQPCVTYSQYLRTGHFWEAVTENWESEFFTNGGLCVADRLSPAEGWPESKRLAGEEAVDRDPRHVDPTQTPPGP